MKSAIITGVSGYVPEQILSNLDLEKIMETNDEWISTRTGIKERRVLPEDQAVSKIGVETTQNLLEKTGTAGTEIDMLICATCTGDYILPDTANTICYRTGLTNAWGYDINAACSGFVFALYTAAQFIKTGAYRKIIVIGGEKMTSYMNYEDRTTSILFGDGGGGVLLEASDDLELGVQDAVLKGDGEGCQFLKVPAGGSLYPVNHDRLEARQQYVTQDGKHVFKRAVNGMSSTVKSVVERNNLSFDDIDWLVPHQANKRIISAVANQLDFPEEKIMVNIEKYGNTSAGTIPLCLWEFENSFKKGDNVLLTAFGGGFTWGTLYLRWAY